MIEKACLFESAEALADELASIFRRDRSLANSGRGSYRKLAQRLGPVLWDGAVTVRRLRDEFDRNVWRDTAFSHHDRADRLARDARQLLKSLRRANSIVSEALERGYLPKKLEILSPLPPTLSDLMNFGSARWDTAVDIHELLERLTREAAEWASKARKDGKRPHGPQRSRARDRLSAWVAIQLADEGIRPTTSKSGNFARVLARVQVVAGFPERSLDQMHRDVLRALKYKAVVEKLGQSQ